mmetsp:Transcript_29138/g.95054  ORF Transcript_29138/g.95054 Transcript_29138/m.95054 type:complete len:263 (+) Transcript_29138:161-949(+)
MMGRRAAAPTTARQHHWSRSRRLDRPRGSNAAVLLLRLRRIGCAALDAVTDVSQHCPRGGAGTARRLVGGGGRHGRLATGVAAVARLWGQALRQRACGAAGSGLICAEDDARPSGRASLRLLTVRQHLAQAHLAEQPRHLVGHVGDVVVRLVQKHACPRSRAAAAAAVAAATSAAASHRHWRVAQAPRLSPRHSHWLLAAAGSHGEGLHQGPIRRPGSLPRVRLRHVGGLVLAAVHHRRTGRALRVAPARPAVGGFARHLRH